MIDKEAKKLAEFKEDIAPKLMEFYRMIHIDMGEDMTKRVQNVNDKLTKDIGSIQRYHTEIKMKMRCCIEFINVEKANMKTGFLKLRIKG